MTTQEHLERIKAKCQSLLAIAEKRTPGRWKTTPKARSVYTDDFNYQVAYTDNPPDSSFIASCAGPAEAGWRATITACDLALVLLHVADPENNNSNNLINKLIAAWPEDIL